MHSLKCAAYTDSATVSQVIGNELLRLNEQSFLSANMWDWRIQSDTLYLFIDKGPSFKWVGLDIGEKEWVILTEAGIRQSQFSKHTVTAKEYTDKANKVLDMLENNGFPFARIWLDSFRMAAPGLAARWRVEQGPFMVFDTIQIMGNAHVKNWYLQRFLGIKPGKPYDERLITGAGARLSQLPFVSVLKQPAVYFYGNKAMPVIHAAHRPAGAFDGIIGFAPASQNNSGKVLFTGEANLRLVNLFESGKSAEVNYRSFLGNSQDLKIRLSLPYLFRSRIGADYVIGLIKQDSSFLDVRQELGIQYRFAGNNLFRVFWNLQTTSLISVDTTLIRLTTTVPLANDVRSVQFGMSYQASYYDYYLNPRKGYAVQVSMAAGNRTILRNNLVESVKWQEPSGNSYSVYDKINLSSSNYRLQLTGEGFIPAGNRSTFRIAVNGSMVYASTLFYNELFRIGGIRSLKGFDEQSIFASRYLIVTGEYRYLIQQSANFLIFWNAATYVNEVRTPVISDTPSGFGAGMNLDTQAGWLSLYYAVGRSFGGPVDWQRAKIHFGLVNYF